MLNTHRAERVLVLVSKDVCFITMNKYRDIITIKTVGGGLIEVNWRRAYACDIIGN